MMFLPKYGQYFGVCVEGAVSVVGEQTFYKDKSLRLSG